jgi:serine phosphatase RsbU (regulator of sigma subunit)
LIGGNIEIDAFFLDFLHSLTILCVESDTELYPFYNEIFEDIVDKIIFADGCEDGYKKFIENRIDIIIVAYDMPVSNGLNLAKKIRKENHDIPIALVSQVQSVDIVMDALNTNISSCIKKPIIDYKILEAVIKNSKILLANKYIKDEEEKKNKELQEKEAYSTFQEDLAFAKELNILRNDFYYQMNYIDKDNLSLIDFLYKPLDVMSGDAYSVRKIDESREFYLVVDGMGKGLSASLTSMLMTSYINHIIDKMKVKNSFDLERLIYKSIEYIKPILLEEEALAIDFIVLDSSKNKMDYAKFAMPATLMLDGQNEVVKLKSNNSPLYKYHSSFKISSFDTTGISKFLFYSDGLIESSTYFEEKLYAGFIEDDFKNSFTREDFKNKIFEKTNLFEDDTTLIFINKLNFSKSLIVERSFNSSLEDVDIANEWYAKEWESLTDDESVAYNAGVVFTELFMNAYEHGNLGISNAAKHSLIEEDKYFDTLVEMEKLSTKKIFVRIDKIEDNASTYIITQITDEGSGFDTQILSEIFRNSRKFNGRGVFVSRKNSLGIYYNASGNSVLYLNKIWL